MVFNKYREGWNAKDNYGNLPLHIAAQYYKRDVGAISSALVEHHEEVKTIRNNEGKLPLQVAIEHEREFYFVKELLRAYPEGVNSLGKLGKQTFSNTIPSSKSPIQCIGSENSSGARAKH